MQLQAAALGPGAIPLCGALVSDAGGFDQIAGEWNDLFRRSGCENVFLSFAWMSTWWTHFGKGQLALIAVRESSGQLVAVAPFYVARNAPAAGARRLGFLADQRVGSDHLEILCDPAFENAAIEEIARVLFAHGDLWDFVELRNAADSPLTGALSRALTTGGMQVRETHRHACRYIALPESFEQYLAGVRIGLRANFRRRWRNLQGEQRAECLAFSSQAGIERHFPVLLALHRMRFEQQKASSAFLAPGVPEFHTAAMRVLAAQGLARLFLLEAGGETVAALYGFVVSRTFQFYQCGMRPAWRRYGVGQVLIGNTIAHTIAMGLTTFDFLRGAEPYKARWADRTRDNVTLCFFDRRPANVAVHWKLRISGALHATTRAVRTRLPRHLFGAAHSGSA